MAPTIILEDLSVIGSVITKGDLQVDGDVQGDVFCSTLLVTDRGRITGAVVAEKVVVQGQLYGSVNALHVTLEATSHVEADIYHKVLKLDPGAMFEGKSRRCEDPLSQADSLSDILMPAETPAAQTRIGRAA